MVRLSRVTTVHLVLALFALALVGQAAKVQLVQGRKWADRARRQQYSQGAVSAARGIIRDASGNVLAESRELMRLTVNLRDVGDRSILLRSLRDAGFPEGTIRQAGDPARKWVDLPGLHVPSDVRLLLALPGVAGQPVLSREYANNAGIRRIVGGVNGGGRGIDGIEMSLDRLLSGDTLRATFARDSRGGRLDSPDGWTSPPRAGNNVTLTINRDLQEICERALARAADSLQATGGDIVVMNPRTGEVLAMASRRAGKGAVANTAVTEPFEPGSTLKPFVAAALLERKKARADEVIDTFNGEMTVDGRRITDSHKAARMSLADVIRFSSNVGIVRFAERLTPRETYEALRDLGVGMATGVPLPAEADGTLREPKRWNRTSAASIVMGYELAVTPLQLVAAYAAIANGGELMEPHIVKEVRSSDGDLIFEAAPRVVRRVMSADVARQMRRMLIGVVDSGTAVRADLATFTVAGKSGTARRTVEGKGYVAGNYTASFVGLFPADKPLYVVLVKLDSPRGAYYGGEIAAPVTSVVLRAALAARDAALDRQDLVNVERDLPMLDSSSPDAERASERALARAATPGAPARPTAAEASARPAPSASTERTPQPAMTIALPFTRKAPVTDRSPRPVPDVGGLTVRDAVRALHLAGFRVTLASGQSVPTLPSAGMVVPAGSIVKLQHNP